MFVPLWITFVYCINAALLWGGGFLAQKGAVDYSGGYVIHLSAGVAGFVAAWVVGPRPREGPATTPCPNNLMLVAVGAGVLWLGLERVSTAGTPSTPAWTPPRPC